MLKKILTGTSINVLGKALNFLFQIILISILIRFLGEELYGLVVLALALLGITNIVESGFGLAITKYIAEYKAKEQNHDILSIINTNFIVLGFLGTVYTFFLFFLSWTILPYIFKIPPQWVIYFRNFITLILPLVVIEFLNVTFVRIAEGYQDFFLARLFENIKWFLRIIFVVIFLLINKNLYSVGGGYLFASLINFFISLFLIERKCFKGVSLINFKFYDRKKVKLVFNFSIWMFLAKFFSFISYKIGVFLIAIFLNPISLTYYNVAFKVFEFLNYGYALLTSTILPLSSELNVKNSQGLSTLFMKSTKYILLIMLPFLLFMFFNIDKFITLWVGKDFSVAVNLSKLFIVMLFFIGFIVSGTQIMLGINELKKLIPIIIWSSLTNFILSIILIRKIGVYGIVISSVISAMLTVVGYLCKIVKTLNITFVYFLRDVFKIIVYNVILLVVLLFNRGIFVQLFIIFFAYIITLKYLVDPKDKNLILNFLKVK